MATYLTSDLHLNHCKPFIYEPRGFSCIEDMNKAIEENWNSVVKEEDDVFILGDLMLGDNEKGIKIIKRLRGKIHVIAGNHDTNVRRALYADCYNVVEVVDAKRLKYNGYNFFLTHYPCLCANKDDNKPLSARLISLCGHSHTKDKWANWDNGIIYHCELDCNDNAPVSIDEIIEELKGKIKE